MREDDYSHYQRWKRKVPVSLRRMFAILSRRLLESHGQLISIGQIHCRIILHPKNGIHQRWDFRHPRPTSSLLDGTRHEYPQWINSVYKKTTFSAETLKSETINDLAINEVLFLPKHSCLPFYNMHTPHW